MYTYSYLVTMIYDFLFILKELKAMNLLNIKVMDIK